MKGRLLAILLSMAMILTFMPTMSFAAPDDSRGEPVSFEISRDGGFEVSPFWTTDGYYDEKEDKWVPESDEYLYWSEPVITETDEIKVTYENGDVVVYHRYEDSDSYLYKTEDGEPSDLTYVSAHWTSEQTYGNQFEAGTTAELNFTAEFDVPDAEDGIKTIESTVNVYLNPQEDDADSEYYDFGDLPTGSIPSIKLNEQKNAQVTSAKPVVTFSFTAPATGRYAFESYGDNDPIGQVRTQDSVIKQVDDSGTNGLNFRVIFDAEKGTTYYLQARGFEQSQDASFQVKVYDATWLAMAESKYQEYEGKPVTLVATFEDEIPKNPTFKWFYNGNEIANNSNEYKTSKIGEYHCDVSDGVNTQRIEFVVELPPVNKDQMSFYSYRGRISVDRLIQYDDAENEIILTKGDITIPASVTFADGIARPVEVIDGFYNAKELTSVNIPASVKEIEFDAFVNTGLRSITIPATVQHIHGKSVGYNNSFDEEKKEWIYTPVTGFVIYGKTNSAAHKYALANGISFKDPEAEAAAAAAVAAAKKAADELAEWNGTPTKSIPAVKSVKFKPAKKKVTVNWKKADKKTLKKFDKVEIQICPDKKFNKSNTKRVEVKKSKKSATVKGLKKGTYYIRVRNVKGTGTAKTVSKWSKAKKIKIK